MQFRSVIGVLVVALLSPSQIVAEPRTEGVSCVRVFECLMPIPSSFIIESNEVSRLRMYRDNGSIGVTHISIGRFESKAEGPFSIIKTDRIGGLSVEELRSELAGNSDENHYRIHDSQQQVLVLGGDRDLIDSMVKGCIARRQRDAGAPQ